MAGKAAPAGAELGWGAKTIAHSMPSATVCIFLSPLCHLPLLTAEWLCMRMGKGVEETEARSVHALVYDGVYIREVCESVCICVYVCTLLRVRWLLFVCVREHGFVYSAAICGYMCVCMRARLCVIFSLYACGASKCA